jgi:hypothetical protein
MFIGICRMICLISDAHKGKEKLILLRSVPFPPRHHSMAKIVKSSLEYNLPTVYLSDKAEWRIISHSLPRVIAKQNIVNF